MTPRTNPFTPTFGMVPPYLAGRDRVLATMRDAFHAGLGNPNLCSLFIGPRGSGKTALLSCIGDEAREAGWIVVDTVAEEGMLEDIIQHATLEAAQVVDAAPHPRLSGLTVGQVGVEWEYESTDAPTWRIRMEALLSKLAEKNVGLLITVDEVRVTVEELVQLITSYQLFIRSGRSVALLMAGLPANVTDLVEDARISFLRRSRQQFLETISDAEVSSAIRKTIKRGGKAIEDEALEKIVQASAGFPYMMQLVGYFTWLEADDDDCIDVEHARLGIKAAQSDFRRGVLDRTWQEMSPGDRAFATAMLPDEDASTLSEVARRMGRATNYASTYKRRLMHQGVIGERGGSSFGFDIPLMREYVAEKSNDN